ncbi:DNA-binding beta-propeller fold protein YncE [Streptacidiphilus sp. MAP12-33]|uniref:YncE family protein n=1 Tax=Streptacidiphilus sp. MAP12-33 TaxID=3156266 RepID=UPI00351969DF
MRGRGHRRVTSGTTAVLLSCLSCLGGCTSGHPGQTGQTALPTARAGTPTGHGDVYVVGQETDTLTPVDPATGSARPPIPLGVACQDPGDLVVNRAGTKAFVECVGTLIEPVDLTTGKVGRPITLSMTGNNDLVLSPDGSRLYALSLDKGLTAGEVTPIDTATEATGRPIPVTGNVDRLALAPDGRHLYALDFGPGGGQTGSLTVIDTTRGTASRPVRLGENPADIVVTPDSRTVFVTCTDSRYLVPLDGATGAPGRPIPLAGNPVDLVMAPDGRTVYVMGVSAPTRSGSAVWPVDTATHAVGAPVDVSGNAMTIAPGGGQVYLYGNATQPTVTWFDTATDRVGPPITVGIYASAMSFSADGREAFVLRDGTDTDDPTTKVVPLRLPATPVGRPVTVLPGPGLMTVAGRGSD